MTDRPDPGTVETPRARGIDALLLAGGGLAAAFGVASCCALPLFLGSVGLGSAWLVTVAWFAAPYRIALLAVATICLASGGLLLWRRQRIAACTLDTGCGRPTFTALTAGTLSLGGVLYQPPKFPTRRTFRGSHWR
jgi:mercuric ion transport protein